MDKKGRHCLTLGLAPALLVGGLGLTWLTQGTGTVRDDPERNIAIPKTLTVPLQVRAAYNGERIFIGYRWPAERPGLLHDVLVYEGGKWVVKGRAVPGSQADGLHEDRVAMLLDDGSVPEFARYGGYVTIGDGIAGFTREADSEAVAAHPHLGGTLKQEDISKSLPNTRSDIGDWSSVRSAEVLAAQRRAGYFLDLWHWRSNRANPLGFSDDQMVAEIRGGDDGKGAAGTNWDGESKQPRLMFDAAALGYKALKWSDVAAGKIDQDSVYYLVEGQAVAFDPEAGWAEGDTLPRRFLRQPEGSKADITVHGQGRWSDGYWNVTLSRALDTGQPLDDKVLHDHGLYDVAFAIHRNATGGRWHYVSLPQTLGLGRDADIEATQFEGAEPVWANDWHEVKLFYPGQVSWPHLNSQAHAGADSIRRELPVQAHHNVDQLAHYGVEAEFADEIRAQWQHTLLAGLALIVACGFALNMALTRKKGV